MRVFWIAAFVLLADQATKAAVLHLMYRHQSIPVLGDWLRLTFTENPGMAFGITIGPPGTITVLSMIATVLVAAYIYQVRDTYPPYRMSLSFIFGGAIGNIIDRVFYGWLLGYGELFTGRVVDFIHVSLWEGFIPPIVPFLGGAYMELFPIWNVADMAIVCGVVGVLFFHHEFHERLLEQQRAPHASEDRETRATPSSARPMSLHVRPPLAMNGRGADVREHLTSNASALRLERPSSSPDDPPPPHGENAPVAPTALGTEGNGERPS
jgi:signal peptidase II